MSTNILFIFEGEKTENQIIDNLKNFFFINNVIITCAYCGTMYQFYKEIEEDKDLDVFNLLKDKNKNKIKNLQGYVSNDFAEIFLFFDYDGHDPKANDDNLKEMLKFFKNETDKGKLYINYPMVESLKHIIDYSKFYELNVECKKNIKYKNVVHDQCLEELKDFSRYSEYIWKKLLKAHIYKMNYIVNNDNSFPSDLISQEIIFSNQQVKFINKNSTISVLNSFPIFIHDYFGNKRTKEMLD